MTTIRSAAPSDLAPLGRMGAALMRQHYDADPRRFILVPHPEDGYGRFLVSQLDDPKSLVVVAEQAGSVVGYLFASLEGVSWRDLRGPCGFVHDVFVEPAARREGVGEQLLRTGVDWIHTHGRDQVVLWSEVHNASAQRLFERFGFRRTMVEMTLDRER